MPNHVTNRLTIHAKGKRLEKILDAIKNDEVGRGSIDFNKIVPMPESLNIESGSRTDNAIEIYLTAINPKMPKITRVEKIPEDIFSNLVKGINSAKLLRSYRTDLDGAEVSRAAEYEPLDNIIERGRAAVNNYLNHGSIDWYDWSLKNWGTKWNAYGYDSYDPDPKSNTVSFLTAWSSVPEVLVKLSKKFPEVELSYRYADENIGCNVGEMKFQDGEVIDEYYPMEQSNEAYEMAFDIMECSAADYGLKYNEETQQYDDVEDEGMSYEMRL